MEPLNKKLNCGAGGKVYPKEEGWINIDKRDILGMDLILDLSKENFPYEDESIDEVWLQDFLEHLPITRIPPFLIECHRILKKGGKVFVQCPDLGRIGERYYLTKHSSVEDRAKDPKILNIDGKVMAELLFGDARSYLENQHLWGWDEDSLKTELEKAGFKAIDIHSDGGSNIISWFIKL